MSSIHSPTDLGSNSSPPSPRAPSSARRAFGRDPEARARSRASVERQLAAPPPEPEPPKPAPLLTPTVRELATDPETMRIRAALWERIAVFAPGVPGPGGLTSRELEDIIRANALERIQAALWHRVTRATGEFDDRWLAKDIAAALRSCGLVTPPGIE